MGDVIAEIPADVIVEHRPYAGVDVGRVAGARDGETPAGVRRRKGKHAGLWRPRRVE